MQLITSNGHGKQAGISAKNLLRCTPWGKTSHSLRSLRSHISRYYVTALQKN